MKHKLFRKAIQWLGIILLAHIVAMVMFGLFLSGYVGELAANELYSEAYVTLFFFNIVFDIFFSVLYLKTETSFVAYRKEMKQAIKDGSFSVIGDLKENRLKEYIARAVVFALFQVPFLIFFTAWGLSLTVTTSFEKFYIMDAGAYAVTRIPIVGFLLNTAIFSLIFLVFHFIFVSAAARSLKKDMI